MHEITLILFAECQPLLIVPHVFSDEPDLPNIPQ